MAEIQDDRTNVHSEGEALADALSACRPDAPLSPAVVRKRRRHGIRLLKGTAALVVLLVVLLGALFASIENGFFDRLLATQAQSTLSAAIGDDFDVHVGSAALRFSSHFALAIEARDVEVVEARTGAHFTHTAAVRLVLDPFALIAGRLRIGGFEADGVDVDTALVQTEGADLASVRIDSLPEVIETSFKRLDGIFHFLDRSQTGDVTLSQLTLRFPGRGEPFAVEVRDLTMERRQNGTLALNGFAVYRQDQVSFSVEGEEVDGRVGRLRARVEGLDIGQLTLREIVKGQPHEGLGSEASLAFTAEREKKDGSGASLKATLTATPGWFYMDGDSQEFNGAELNLAYDYQKNSIEFTPSRMVFGRTVLPFTGAVIDRDRVGDQAGPGYALDFLFSGAVSGATEAPPLAFDAKVTGFFDTALNELHGERLHVASAQGQLGGSFVVRFKKGISPEISFGGRVPEMTGEAVKQLWPFWMARKPREWAIANLDGGVARNGTISVFIPAGRLHFPPEPIDLNENELHITFDVERIRVDLPHDIPPLREANGHVEILGGRAEVALAKGVSYFGSGRSVTLEDSRFLIANAYEKPLMADIALKLQGDSAALLELSSFKPMNSLKNTDFRPEDFSGPARATVNVRLGLIEQQGPPPPDWKAHIDLDAIDLHKQIGGRMITEARGGIDVTPQALKIAATAKADGAPVTIAYAQPLAAGDEKPSLQVSGNLDKKDWIKLAPDLGDLVDGPIAFEMKRVDDNRQAVTVNLGAASVSLPWIGWAKGVGVPANASFDLSTNGNDSAIRNFKFGGDGFGASGSLAFNGKGLVAADLQRVQLAPGDDFGVKVKSVGGGFSLAVNGKSLDVRHVIRKFRTDYEGEKTAENGKGGAFTATLNVASVTGFNDEVLKNVSGRYVLKSGKADVVDLTAVTGSGQALVSKMLKDGRGTVSITSGDAGAFARFLDLYSNLSGGLLNLKLAAMDSESWSGSIDIRGFRLANEQRLQSLVTTPSGKDGRSLNSAVKRDIDVSSANFERAFARLVIRNGVLVVENGVLRGDQVGATFQGTVRDRRGNMDMTGTFMPAYGLNRLFAELPLIGSLLGNGRDRGLIGITFRMTGKFTQPKLIVNPLSVIAPGIFRQIFEY